MSDTHKSSLMFWRVDCKAFDMNFQCDKDGFFTFYLNSSEKKRSVSPQRPNHNLPKRKNPTLTPTSISPNIKNINQDQDQNQSNSLPKVITQPESKYNIVIEIKSENDNLIYELNQPKF